MSYKVINKFIDKESKTLYEVGEGFPKGNSKSSQKRIEELLSVHPTYNYSFIEKVEERTTKRKTKKQTEKE